MARPNWLRYLRAMRPLARPMLQPLCVRPCRWTQPACAHTTADRKDLRRRAKVPARNAHAGRKLWESKPPPARTEKSRARSVASGEIEVRDRGPKAWTGL